MERLIVDTGAGLAFVNRKDRDHDAVREILVRFEAWRLFRERAGKEYSFTDCTSFVVMRRLGLERAAALDDDFRREGFTLEP